MIVPFVSEAMSVVQHLFQERGDVTRPCPLLRQMVRAGQLGVRSGRGFFDYGENGQVQRKEPA